MTVSFGYRAPTYQSMLVSFCAHVCETSVSEDLIYADPFLNPQVSQGDVQNLIA